MERRYAFFLDKATDWGRVCAMYGPLAIGANDEAAIADVIRQVLWELYDSHCGVRGLAAGT